MYFMDGNGAWNLFYATGNPLFYMAYKRALETLDGSENEEEAEIRRQKR